MGGGGRRQGRKGVSVYAGAEKVTITMTVTTTLFVFNLLDVKVIETVDCDLL